MSNRGKWIRFTLSKKIQKQIIVDYLSGLTPFNLSKKYKVSAQYIRNFLIKNNIKIRDRSEAGNQGLGHLCKRSGYVYVTAQKAERHLVKGSTKRTTKQRLVMAKHLGRALTKYESVHHKDGNRQNNDIANLELWSRFQPKGQRVEDKIKWALELLHQYGYKVVKK